nr:transposase [Mycoplasmopsis bovis]
MSVKEVINLYSKQWQIESNFKTLKGKLSLRPMYCINYESHIVRLRLFMFHFISIFKLHHLHSKFKIRTDWKK